MSIRDALVRAREHTLAPYRAIRMSRFVWFHILNREARKLLRTHMPVLPSAGKRVVEDLREKGIAITSLQELFPNENLLPVFEAYAESLRGYAQQQTTKKPFILEYWDAFPTLSLDNPFVRFSLDARVLAIVNSYLGIWAKFYYFMLGRTRVIDSAVAKPTASQRWHRDFEEWRMCKVFIYLSDVDTDSGPFTYILGSHRGELRARFPQKFGRDSYPPEGAVDGAVERKDIYECVGPKGTVVFADTTGLHKGGYARKHERLMFTAGYKSAAGYGYRRYYLSDEERERVRALSPEAMYALNGLKPGEPLPV